MDRGNTRHARSSLPRAPNVWIVANDVVWGFENDRASVCVPFYPATKQKPPPERNIMMDPAHRVNRHFDGHPFPVLESAIRGEGSHSPQPQHVPTKMDRISRVAKVSPKRNLGEAVKLDPVSVSVTPSEDRLSFHSNVWTVWLRSCIFASNKPEAKLELCQLNPLSRSSITQSAPRERERNTGRIAERHLMRSFLKYHCFAEWLTEGLRFRAV